MTRIFEPIPELVRELIDRYLESMEHVELLLLLARDEFRGWGAADAAAAVHADPGLVRNWLADLQKAKLIREEKNAASTEYRYAPASLPLRDAVGQLQTLYDTRPVTLVKAIYSRTPRSLRSFSDAFRLGPSED